MQTCIDSLSRALAAGLAGFVVLGTVSIAAEAATLTSNPTEVVFGKVRVGTVTSIVLTEQDGDAASTVMAVVDNANFTLANVPAAVGASGMGSFDVTCAAAGDHAGIITVSWTDAGSGGSIQIAASCNAPAMWVATTTDPFGFPVQEVGTSSAPESFVITNDLGAAAEITEVATAGTNCANFPVATDPPPIALAAGATTSIMVQFAPSFRGSHTCSLTIVDDIAGIPDNTLGLTGTGEGAAIQLTPAGTINLGDQRVGTTSAATSLTIANVGDPGYSLDVTSIGKTGTAAADFSLGGFTSGSIAQGASADVTITFSPSAAGTRNATLAVNTSEPSGISATKSVTGTGVQRLLVPDPLTVEIGEVRINGSTFADGTLQMTNPGGAPVQVNNLVLAGGQAADFSLVSPPMLPHDIAGGSQSPLTLRCNPSVIGLRSDTLTISSNDDGPSPDDVTIRCTGVRSYVSMSSVADIDFGAVLVGTTGSRPLTVSNVNNANVVSLNGTSTAEPSTFSSTLTVISNLTGGGSIPFEVRFSPTTDGTVTGTLTIATDDPVTPTITINLTGRGVQPAGLVVTPDAFDFGDVGINDSVLSPPFVVDSTGDGVLTVGSLSVTGPHAGNFIVENDQCSGQGLPNGDFCGFEVRYTRSGGGPHQASVVIPSDAPDSPHSVEVSGTSSVVFVDGFEM